MEDPAAAAEEPEVVLTFEEAFALFTAHGMGSFNVVLNLSRQDIMDMAYLVTDATNSAPAARMAFSRLSRSAGNPEALQELEALITARGLDFFQNHQWLRTAGNNGLMVACKANNSLTAQLLIDRGHRTDLQNDLGETAIDIAARHDCLPVALLLIENGVDVPASALDAYGLALEAPPVQVQGPQGQGPALAAAAAPAAAPLGALSEETKQERRAVLVAARRKFVRDSNWSRRRRFCMYLATSGHRPLQHRLDAPGYAAPPKTPKLDVFAGDPVMHIASFL